MRRTAIAMKSMGMSTIITRSTSITKGTTTSTTITTTTKRAV